MYCFNYKCVYCLITYNNYRIKNVNNFFKLLQKLHTKVKKCRSTCLCRAVSCNTNCYNKPSRYRSDLHGTPSGQNGRGGAIFKMGGSFVFIFYNTSCARR